jgi:hypothetical protein
MKENPGIRETTSGRSALIWESPWRIVSWPPTTAASRNCSSPLWSYPIRRRETPFWIANAVPTPTCYNLRTDPGLDPLRQRDDFKKILAELEEKTKSHEEATAAGKAK